MTAHFSPTAAARHDQTIRNNVADALAGHHRPWTTDIVWGRRPRINLNLAADLADQAEWQVRS